MNNSPCLNCNDRTDYGKCHDSCEKYKQSKKNQANVQAARSEFVEGKSITIQSVRRCKK